MREKEVGWPNLQGTKRQDMTTEAFAKTKHRISMFCKTGIVSPLSSVQCAFVVGSLKLFSPSGHSKHPVKQPSGEAEYAKLYVA